MEKSAGKGLTIGYTVVAILMALMMCISASGKFTQNEGAVKVLTGVGVPLSMFWVLGVCEIAGGLGLLAGIYRPKLGVAGGAGLVLYFVGAMLSHVRVGDWAGLTAPIVPLIMSCTALTLAIMKMRRAA